MWSFKVLWEGDGGRWYDSGPQRMVDESYNPMEEEEMLFVLGSTSAIISNVASPCMLTIPLRAWMSMRPKYSHSNPSPTNTDAEIRWDYVFPASAAISFMVNLCARDNTSRCTETRLWAANSHHQSDRIPGTCCVVIYFNRYSDRDRKRRTSVGSGDFETVMQSQRSTIKGNEKKFAADRDCGCESRWRSRIHAVVVSTTALCKLPSDE